MNKQKLLIAAGIFPPDIGGPATYARYLCKELPKVGFLVKVITYGEGGIKIDGIDLFNISKKQNVLLRYFKYFYQAIKLIKWADTVYLMGSVSEGLPATMANLFHRKKLVLKVVGDFAWEQAQNQFGLRDDIKTFQRKKYGFKIELWRKIQRSVARRADVIVTPSEYLKKIVEPWGIPETKIKVVYNAFEEPDLIDEKIKMPEGDIIFTAGRLVPWKGIDTLIKIMPNLIEKNHKLILLVAGDGPERGRLERLRIDLRLEKNIFFLGKISREKLLGYLKKSTLFILNSSYEGLSHQILEALWLGIPTAASRVGGNAEIIQDGKNGFLFEYNDTNQIKKIILAIIQKTTTLPLETPQPIDKKFSSSHMLSEITKILSNESI